MLSLGSCFQNPSTRYPILIYVRDPLCLSLCYNGLTALGFLLYLYFSWGALPSLSLFFVAKCLPIAAIWFWVLRKVCNGEVFRTNKFYCRQIRGTNVVITGANGGIGLECARQVAKCGGNVYMGCRGKQQETFDQVRRSAVKKTQKIEVLHLDLEEEATIRSFATSLLARNINIDVLVNNAGTMMVPSLIISKVGVESTIATNHLGHFLLTRMLLDSINACGGRVVNVSSLAHSCCGNVEQGIDFDEIDNVSKATYDPLKFYGISKLCNILFTKELQKRFSQSNSAAVAYAVHPGAVRSSLYRNMRLLTMFSPLTMLVETLLLKDTHHGCFTHLFAILSDRNDLHPGAYYADCAIGLVITAANNMKKAKELWQWSENKWNLGK